MKNKSEMYHNKILKEFTNNKKVFASYDKENNSVLEDTNIRKKIDEILNANSFIYSKLVNIKMGNNIIKKKIIGIYNDNLITILNEYIPIDSISDIYI